MLSVPRRANDALHLGMMRGFDEDIGLQGEVILQDSFQVSKGSAEPNWKSDALILIELNSENCWTKQRCCLVGTVV